MNTEQQQCLLGALGYYALRRQDGTLAIDGKVGEATRAAIFRFQKDHEQRPDGSRLQTDGIWGRETEQAIRQVIGTDEDMAPGTYRWVDPEAFRCRCAGKYCGGWPARPSEKILGLLEQIGEHFRKPIQAHSGCRCLRWNEAVGGSPGSRHLTGSAMDFHLEGVSHQALYDYAESLLGDSGGLGLYDWGIHLDDREQKGRWRG